MLIAQIDQNDTVIIDLLNENDFYNVQVAGFLFCVHVRYQNLEYVGAGSQGIVCSAFDCVRNQIVAIKKITNPFADLEDAKHAYRELKVLKLVEHKHIIKLLDAFITSTNHQHRQSSSPFNGRWSCSSELSASGRTDEGQLKSSVDHQKNHQTSTSDVIFTNSFESNQNDLYLIMEYVETNLSQIVQQRPSKPLGHDRLSHLIYQMFCALKYLHDASIIHRDLKPSNIAVQKNELGFWSIKILDFGLARNENELMMSPYVQTRYYRAPELVLDLGSYSGLVDVWSIGCIMGELITGKVLFCGTNSVDQWEKIAELLGTPDQSFIKKLPSNVGNYILKRPRKRLDFREIFPDSMFASSDDSPSEQSKRNEQARDLLSRMLVIDPAKRITIEQALLHSYLERWRSKEDFTNNSRIAKRDALIDKDYQSIEDWQELINREVKTVVFY